MLENLVSEPIDRTPKILRFIERNYAAIAVIIVLGSLWVMNLYKGQQNNHLPKENAAGEIEETENEVGDASPEDINRISDPLPEELSYFHGVIPGPRGGEVWCTREESPRKLNEWMIAEEKRYIKPTEMFVVDGKEIEPPVSTFDWRWFFGPDWYTENGGVCISEGGPIVDELPLDN